MTKKRHQLLVVAVAGLLFLAISAFLIWRNLLVTRSTIQATSPDSRFVTIVNSTFYLSTNYYDIRIMYANGQLVRHIAIHDKLPGWATDPSISWAADSQTVTMGLVDTDTGVSIKRLTIEMP